MYGIRKSRGKQVLNYKKKGDEKMKIGEKYGKLTIVDIFRKPPENRLYAYCICDCGNKKDVRVTSILSKKKPVRSCGCLRLEMIHQKKTIHGDSGGAIVGKRNRLYRIWSNIKSRCYNKKVRSYTDYGAKGIKMCDEWLNNYVAFKEWALTHGYQDNLVIDRIDSKKNYCPENCQWITLQENSRKVIEEHPVYCWGKNLDGGEYYEFYNIREFARQHDLNYSAIDQVLHKHNKTHKNWIFHLKL